MERGGGEERIVSMSAGRQRIWVGVSVLMSQQAKRLRLDIVLQCTFHTHWSDDLCGAGAFVTKRAVRVTLHAAI